MQKRLGITFIFVTHDQEEALTMSDTIVVLDKGKIQQIGTPEDIYNEPENAFTARFIGESNIIDGTMIDDYLVEFANTRFKCVDFGFEKNEEIEVVIRPEDVELVSPEDGMIKGIVESVMFKGVYYEMLISEGDRSWKAQSIKLKEKGDEVGIYLDPESLHIMRKGND